jgi:aspartate aminotransferase
MPNVSGLFGKRYADKVLHNSLDVAAFILEEAQVAVVPGLAFEAPDNISISYSTLLGKIEKGMNSGFNLNLCTKELL